ncbi:MAG: F0F1 ATP synthase subunit B [Hormoscilla sp.]
METVILLATEASHEGGFGFNFNILETNLINLAIVIGVLFYFGSKVLGETLSKRSGDISQALKEVETRQKEAASALADQQQKLAAAQTEAERIKKEAEARAVSAKEAIMAKSSLAIERLREEAAQDLNREREQAIAQLRRRVVEMALSRAESRIKESVDAGAQQQLIDRSISMLGG